MFQNNPLLAQLKQQLHATTPRIEGTVKGTDKNFGFLDADDQKTYFIPPQQMKKVMHGDRVSVLIQVDKGREIAEPESLISPFLNRFVGRIHKKDNKLFVIPDHPNIKEAILSRPNAGFKHDINHGDWVVAKMGKHPLDGGNFFSAEIVEFVAEVGDCFAPWWVTLARNQLDKAPPQIEEITLIDENIQRNDFTHLNFFTIDSETTEDMDDALYLEQNDDDTLTLYVAIADPTAYIAEGSELDLIAKKRAFTHYLPGFEIPMLPTALSHNVCSLQPDQKRPALVCIVNINADGGLDEDIQFYNSWIISKAKLAYSQVSDWIEHGGPWQPSTELVAHQLRLLQRFSSLRMRWRQENALTFKERPDYRFILDDSGSVINIATEQRRVANRMIEEAMIAVNICAAQVLAKHKGYGIFNAHSGFDPNKIDLVIALLKENGIQADPAELQTLKGFCHLKQRLDQQPSAYLDIRTRRYQSYAEMSTKLAPHFGLGLNHYATWTSPIRKYGDMINHRIIKSILSASEATPPNDEIINQLTERRRLNRVAEREIKDWLYCRYLQDKVDPSRHWLADITDVTRGGVRARLVENGASIFIPAALIHPVRDELICNSERGIVQIKGDIAYYQGDQINVTLTEVRIETRHIIAKVV